MNESKIPIVLLTRFSVRSAKFMQAAGIDSERERRLWFKHRAALFRSITLPSMRAQVRRPDKWVLLFSAGDENMVERWLDGLDPWISPVFLRAGLSVAKQVELQIQATLREDKQVLVSRLDSDDALRPDFFARVHQAAQEVGAADELAILVRHGSRWDGEHLQQLDYPNNPFITLYARDWPARRCSPLQMDHMQVLSMPHRFIDTGNEASWLQALHGANASNEFKPSHGPVVPVPPAQVMSDFNMLPNALKAIRSMRETRPAVPAATARPEPATPAPLDTKTARPRRLNALAQLIGAQSYLEIGVATGATFFAVDVDRKVAVDPRFKFDPTEQSDPRATYHTMTSNDYFAGPGFGERFDLAYVDGLHTFEQTLIDFQAALLLGHARSVILIDDTVPNDVFSAYPNQKIAFKYRAKAGSKSLVWHGDVYKLVVYIHDFMPMLSYKTFLSGGNPQTVVWREPRTGVQPICGNLEKVARLDYFWLMENFGVLSAAPEPEVLEHLSAWAVRSGHGREST